MGNNSFWNVEMLKVKKVFFELKVVKFTITIKGSNPIKCHWIAREVGFHSYVFFSFIPM